MAQVLFNEERCKGCALCVPVCPKHIVHIRQNTLNKSGYRPATVTEQEKCIGCASCAIICPDCVIRVER